jgi:hypothetical protein
MGDFAVEHGHERLGSRSAPTAREVAGSSAAAVGKSKLPEMVGEGMSQADIGR